MAGPLDHLIQGNPMTIPTTPTTPFSRSVLLLALGLAACTPSPGDSSPSTPGTGGVNAARTGGSTGSGGGTAGGGNGSSTSGGSGGSVSGSGGTTSAGSGGSTSTASGGSGSAASGGAGGSKSDAAPGGTSDAGGAEIPPATGGMTTWDSCGGLSFKPGVSAVDFCMKYESACMFGGAAGKTRYASMADCIAKYSALSDGPLGGKACVAWHLCIAATPSTADTYCPHAPEASAMTGPCKAAYL